MTKVAPAQESAGGARLLRILIADDHAIVRSGLSALIEGAGDMEVIGEARTGEEAVRLARTLEPDVVVMDVTMPGMDGAEATELITQESPTTRVLALTMHDDRAHLTRMLEAGATGYAVKRAAGDELLQAIRAVGGGDGYVDPLLAGTLLRDGDAPETEVLSPREEEVLRRTAWGETNKTIAAALGISTRTVETYKARIADKLKLRSRPEMVRYAVEKGWLAGG